MDGEKIPEHQRPAGEASSPLLRVEAIGGTHRLIGELDLSTAHLLKDAVDDGRPGVVLDASLVSFIDVAGLHAIIGLAKRAGLSRVTILRPSRQVERLLEVLDGSEWLSRIQVVR